MKTPCENLAGKSARAREQKPDPRIEAARLELRAFFTSFRQECERRLDTLQQMIWISNLQMGELFGDTTVLNVVTESVSAVFVVPIAAIYGRTRVETVSIARQAALYLSRRCTDLKLDAIGSHFGGRDHGTVLHAMSATQARMATSERFKKQIETLEQSIRARLASASENSAPSASPREPSPISNLKSQISNLKC